MELIKKYLPYIVIIIILFFWFQSCENQKAKINDLKTEMSIDSLDYVTLKDKSALQEVKIISSAKKMKELVEEVEDVRKINRQIKATVRTRIVKVDAEPITKIKTVHDTIRDSSGVKIKHFLKLPQAYRVKNDWVAIQYNIDTLGQSVIDTATFITKPVITFGYKDQGFVKNVFKSNVPVVSYKDKNPYSTVQGLQNLEFKPKTKWYQRKIVWMGAGFVSGIYIATKL